MKGIHGKIDHMNILVEIIRFLPKLQKYFISEVIVN